MFIMQFIMSMVLGSYPDISADGNGQDLYSDGEMPILNGLAEGGVHTESSVSAQVS